MKYKITLSGYGEELIVAPITEEFFNHFNDNGLSFDDYMSGDMADDLPEPLKDIYDADRRYDLDSIVHAYGAYMADQVNITVTDENENVIYVASVVDPESKHQEDFLEDVDLVNCGHQYIVIGREWSKGLHEEYFLDLLDQFDPSKLTILHKEYDEHICLIESVKYGEVELDPTGDVDTRGIGAKWIIRDNDDPLEEI